MPKKSINELQREHHPSVIKQRLREPQRHQYISDAVLGGIDGCITTFAVVAGAYGAGFSSSIAIVLGFANLLADGFSMAVSNYEAIRTQQEFVDKIAAVEAEHIAAVPDGEREEIRQIYANKGFSGETLDAITEQVTSDHKLWINTMLTEEHGLQRHTAEPLLAGLTTFIAFLLVGSCPLLPLLWPELTPNTAFVLSIACEGLIFFVIGSLKGFALNKPPILAGLRTLATGGCAAILAFYAGDLLERLFIVS
ncbi:hypothetical protein GYB62_02775 [bacterium]|nr:hypothetical protein [bacterium]